MINMDGFCLSDIIKQLEYILEFDEKQTKNLSIESEPRNTQSPKQSRRSPIHIMHNPIDMMTNQNLNSCSSTLRVTHEGQGKKISENINRREKRPNIVRLLKLKHHHEIGDSS